MATGWAPETPVVEWMKKESAAEAERLKSMGQPVLVVPVSNVGVIIDMVPTPEKMAGKMRREVVNRIEAATAFDFNRVRQIMLSPATPCPVKAGYSMLNVILTIDSPTALPLLLGYLYDASVPGNDLRSWLFVNKLGLTSRHQVTALDDVGG
jgi:hypothetical protein